MLLSVLINTYNRPDSLARCLEALAARRDEAPFEAVVIDDGGQAGLGEIERRWRGALDLRLMRIEHEGRSGARNHGLRQARGERVLFIGDDVLVQPGCLARHAACADPRVALLGSYRLHNLRGSPPFRRWAEVTAEECIKDPANAGFQFFCTGNLSAGRDTLLDLGGFDPRFSRVYGWEDIDLGLSFERAGGRIVFDPQARALHVHSFTRQDLWRCEAAMGVNAWVFWIKWAAVDPKLVEFMKFWDDPATLRPPSALRRRLGDAALALLDRIAPASALNRQLYERMIFSYRLEGLAQAWRENPRQI